MAEIQLTDGAVVVTVYEAPEERSSSARPLDVLHTTAGDPIVYERRAGLREVPISGRLLSSTDVNKLETWTAANTLVTLIERDGTTDPGWRIKPGPPPRIRRKDGDSADWLVDMRLWRIP
jgi:hypothetical protein